MARARDPNRDKAFELYKQHKGNIPLKDIAAELGKGEGTVRGWKNKDDWDGQLNGTLQSDKQNAPNGNTERSNVKGEKQSASSPTKPERKRSGNPNPKNQFSHRNNPKWTHGLRSKFLHQEQIEIIEAFEDATVADKLWIQLEIKFSAIIRMQKIMWVEDENDISRAVTMEISNAEGDTAAYKVAFAYEKYETYIKAFARASAEYRNLADSFLKHAGEDDERRLKLQKMQLDIDKSNIEIEALKKNDGNQVTKVVFVDDISGDNNDD
ncbi:phage terminase small subunit [Solibacillus isronensis]|uniref:phage terminase small subunit n=1 Tax=Solibacillus isronensis TaxID=412383 RepID=UPI0039A2A0A0